MINPYRFLRRARLAIYGVLGLLVLYGILRFDIVRLPAEGISPVREFQPGDRLILDRYFGTLEEGNVVFFEGKGEEILLGRVAQIPPSAPADQWQAIEAGALWIEADRIGVPVDDSWTLGPISRERIRARVSFAVPW